MTLIGDHGGRPRATRSSDAWKEPPLRPSLILRLFLSPSLQIKPDRLFAWTRPDQGGRGLWDSEVFNNAVDPQQQISLYPVAIAQSERCGMSSSFTVTSHRMGTKSGVLPPSLCPTLRSIP